MNEDSIFWEALEKSSADERVAFLDQACAGNAELRNSVERLLAAHERADEVLHEKAPGLPVADTCQSNLSLGMPIGPYKLLEQIGEGGMGTVFVAQQSEPLKRLVALKLIKAGMDSRQVIARFEGERQALALMDHPNIAKVFDAGVDARGRPYFVMELVKGVPITQYCDQRHLTPKQRLELFIPVCQAIQHAHQKGIIHRDLKPSNVLVALYDDQPVPKIIDFGVAKATGQQLTEQTLHTGFGTVVGTLEYMSPEQATFNQLDVDTRSDVYSLGILLYVLLAGSPPFTRKELEQSGMLEMLRVIREEEPSRPSTRLSSSDALPTLSANRGTEPSKLMRLVRGELDWIVMKALEKDRSRRYETANGLAMDVQRYLADEPVLACPPSALYRFRKFARRNQARLLTGGTLAVAFLVIAAVVAASLGSAELGRQFRQAKLRHEVELAIDEAKLARERALTLTENPYQWDAALAAADSAVKSAERIAAPDEAALAPDLKDALQSLKATMGADKQDRQFVARFDAIRLERSPVYTSFELTKNTYPAIGQALDDFYHLRIAITPEDKAQQAVRQRPGPIQKYLLAALEMALLYAPREDAAAQAWLKNVLASVTTAPWRQRARQAVQAEDWQALEILVVELAAEGQPAADLLRYADRVPVKSKSKLAMLRLIRQKYPVDFWANHQLANTLHLSQPPQLDEAIRYYQAAAVLRPQSATVAVDLATALRHRGNYEQALDVYQDALCAGADNARAQLGMAWTLLALNRPDEARRAMREATVLPSSQTIGTYGFLKDDLAEEMARTLERVRRDSQNSWPHNYLGNIFLFQELPAEAEREQRLAIGLNPKGNVAKIHVDLGRALEAQQKFEDAEKAYREAIRLDRNHGRAHGSLGWLLMSQQRYAEAEKEFREGARLRPQLANPYFSIARALFEQRKFPEAEKELREAIKRDPANSGPPRNLLARVLAAQGKPEEEAPAASDEITAKMGAGKGTGLTPNAAGFTPLFNGKDLSGWGVTPDGTGMWKIEDGALTCTGPGDLLPTTRTDFGDFHLRAEVKINANGNSGIYFRTSKPFVLVGDYEAQITSNPEERNKTGSLYDLARQTESPVPPETWFTLEIIAIGQRIRVLVNDQETADYAESVAGWNTKGRIALEHQDEKTRVFFRKIEIKELPPGTAAAEYAVRSKVAVPPKETGRLENRASANFESGEFVLIGGPGVAERKVVTLAAAVEGARGGETIEIRGNGPFITAPINCGNTALTIRAGEGFRPVIKLSLEAQQNVALLTTNAPLVLEGLEIHRAVSASEAPLRVANCRFRANFSANGSPVCVLRNCEFLANDATVGMTFRPGARVIIENCLHRTGRQAIAFVWNDVDLHDVSIQIKGSTVVSRTSSLWLALRSPLSVFKDRPEGLFRLEVSGCLFDAPTTLGFWQDKQFLAQAAELGPAEAEATLLRLLDWRGERNLFATDSTSVGWYVHGKKQASPGPGHGPKNLEEWREFWGTGEPDSLDGFPQFQGGDLLSRIDADLDHLTPDDFRLCFDSAGYRAGPDGKDIGADVDLVGPGAAYEKWKQTPEYRQWQNDAGQTR